MDDCVAVEASARQCELLDPAAAYSRYVEAARSFLQLARSSTSASDRQLARNGAARALDRANKIKAVRVDVQAPTADPTLPASQVSVLLRASTVHGVRLRECGDPALDPLAEPPFSDEQQRCGAVWAVPPSPATREIEPHAVTQAVVPDCSLVAGLIACFHHHRRFGTNLHRRCLLDGNPSDALRAAFHVNGQSRQLCVSTRLPMDPGGRLLACNAGGALWAAWIEKAFLTLMGGYAFAGSFSSSDVQLLTGWIPEVIALESAAFRLDETWARLRVAFELGRCVITGGTGSDRRWKPDDRLADRHDYALIEMRESGEQRQIVVMDPWRRPSDGLDLSALRLGPEAALNFEWRSFCDLFATVHVNWDPSSWACRSSLHLAWPEDGGVEITIALKKSVAVSIEVTILATLHLPAVRGPTDFLGLTTSSAEARKYSNAGHDLIRANLTREGLTVLVERRGKTSPSFTFEVFSQEPVTLSLVGPRLRAICAEIFDCWSASDAGGSHSEVTFPSNPQFLLSPPSGRTATISVELDAPRGLSTNLKVFRGTQRLTSLVGRPVVADSGPYGSSCRIANLELSVGSILVCSTFAPSQEADFTLRVRSDLPVTVTKLPGEGAGMFKRQVRVSSSPGHPARIAIQVIGTTVRFSARAVTQGSTGPAMTMQLYARGLSPVSAAPLAISPPGPASIARCEVAVGPDGLHFPQRRCSLLRRVVLVARRLAVSRPIDSSDLA